MKELKTNAMRLLDSNNIKYNHLVLDINEALDGVTCSQMLNYPQERMYKTLVTVSKGKNYYVFVIPVAETLDLKKSASLVNEKSIDMLPLKELLPLTGYVHGGCSPLGMRKVFKTVFHNSINNHEKIVFSGGKIGHFIELNPLDINKVLDIIIGDIIL